MKRWYSRISYQMSWTCNRHTWIPIVILLTTSHNNVWIFMHHAVIVFLNYLTFVDIWMYTPIGSGLLHICVGSSHCLDCLICKCLYVNTCHALIKTEMFNLIIYEVLQVLLAWRVCYLFLLLNWLDFLGGLSNQMECELVSHFLGRWSVV